MAEALASQHWNAVAAECGVQLCFVSAGLGASPGQTASAHASRVVSEHGGDLSGHRSRAVADVGMDEIRLFLAMTQAHRDALRSMFPDRAREIITLSEFAGRKGDVADPFGGGPEVYAESFDQIRGLIEAATPALCELLARGDEESPAAIDGRHIPEKGQRRA